MLRRSFREGLHDALAGLWFCISTQRNMRFHLAATVLVLAVAWWLPLRRLELALVVFAICLVLTTEIFNTAVERTVDLYTSTYHPLARLAKDIAAGAVLVAAINAVVVGLLVFLPHLLSRWGH